jgi:hypothetical protein
MGAIIRAATKLGVSVEPPSSGSHWKFRRPGFRVYPIPAHNGERTEISDRYKISDRYIRALCRALEIDEQELRGLL